MKSKIYLLFHAFSSNFSLKLIGNLFYSEILALFLIPYTKLFKLLKTNKSLRKIIYCLLLLLIAQIISDFYNNSIFEDYSRGLAVIIFCIISSLFLYNSLNKKPRGIVYILVGFFLTRLFFGEEELDLSIIQDQSNYFKKRFVGFLNPLIMIITYLFYENRKKKLAILTLIFYALICIVLGARSNFLIYLVSASLLYFYHKKNSISYTRLFFITLTGVFIFYGLYAFYITKSLNNEFVNHNTQGQLKLMENPYNPFELLFIGRLDFFIGIEAVKDSPVFGHGSWAKDKTGKYMDLARLLYQRDNVTDKGVIPSHSILISSWLYAGIIGFIAILAIFIIILKKFIFIFKNSEINLMPIIIILFVGFIWHFFFSPFGHLRNTVPLVIALITTMHNKTIYNEKHIS